MVIIGGITRLTGSGLSIVEWKPVTGIVPPINSKDWEKEFEKYKQFPQYQLMNYNMSLPEFKQIYFWEYLHRLLGRLIGIVFIIPFVAFYFKRWIPKKLMRSLVTIFLLGGLQGFAGWYMVKSGLNAIPHVSHFRLAIHQGLALLLIGALFWTVLSFSREKRLNREGPGILFNVTFVTLVLLASQISLGALVAGLKAGLSYTNFPWMGDSFFPSRDLIASESLFYNGALLQFIHRWLAFLVLICFIVLFFSTKPYPELHKKAKWLLALGGSQVTLGIITLLMSVPVVLGVAHQFVAILILMALITLLHAQLYSHLTIYSKVVPDKCN